VHFHEFGDFGVCEEEPVLVLSRTKYAQRQIILHKAEIFSHLEVKSAKAGLPGRQIMPYLNQTLTCWLNS
jgi:hypothetical protein